MNEKLVEAREILVEFYWYLKENGNDRVAGRIDTIVKKIDEAKKLLED